MPQAIDAPSRHSKLPAEPSRAARATPKQSFDDLLARKTRVPVEADPIARSKTEEPPAEEAAADEVEAPKSKKTKATDKKSEADSTEPEAETEGTEETDEQNRPQAVLSGLPVKDESGDAEADGEIDGIEKDATKPIGDEDDSLLDLTALGLNPAAQASDPVAAAVAESSDADVEIAVVPIKTDALTAEAEAPIEAVPAQAGVVKAEAKSDGDAADSQPGDQRTIKLPELAVTESPAATTDAEFELPPAAPVTSAPAPAPAAAASAPSPAAAPEQRFIDSNAGNIVRSIQTELMPSGGTMKMHLSPEHLGQLRIEVTVESGVVTAAFQTNNDEATRLLSHSLQQLKGALEAAGVTVDRIQVKQAPAADASSSSQQNGEEGRQQQGQQDHSARQEQQRREALQRMWRKVALGDNPLDLVA
ncbi:MAG TPA: flagellar hook-length control protein FliK [Tepidisphaeraceae bacterium]|jgi:flagellar hook-length control protein FliK